MRILITGGAGFIGSRLSVKLTDRGHKVTLLDTLSTQIHGENPYESDLVKSIPKQVVLIKGDVQDQKLMEELITQNEAIIHLAAETGTGQSMYEIQHYSAVNIQATATLMDLLTNKKHSIQKVVVASSRAIYGEGQYECETHGMIYPSARAEADLLRGDFKVKCPHCNTNAKLVATSEESRVHPTSIYGVTKQVQEQMVMIAGEAVGLPVTALRYQNVYGPGQSLKNPYTGILSIFSTRILNNNPISIFEDGLESRDFVYIDDVVDATVMSLEMEEANGEVFNVGSGVPVTVLEVTKTLLEMYGSDLEYNISGNFRLGDIRHNFADLKKIKEKLGFSPKFSFAQGIKNFTDWVKTQQVEEDKYEQSIMEMKAKGLYK